MIKLARMLLRLVMQNTQIILAALWIMLMLTYLLGDVLRVYAGDFKPGEINGQKMTSWMPMLMAVIMLIPILMIFATLTMEQSANRWANIIVAVLCFLFNLVGLPGYPGAYDKFLLAVSLVFNLMTIWYAWNWVS
jgi:hypothetical protein